MRVREIFLGMFVILVFGFLIIYIYRYESRKSNRELAKKITELSPRGGPPETIDGLRQAIALYEDQIERNVREAAQTGVYWKILATRLSDRGLHNEALEALDRAIYFAPEDPILYYLTGVSAANVAKSKVGFTADAESQRAHYYRLAENSYSRALELDITYGKAMYGLAVLYVFELDRPADAIVHLERYMQIQTADFGAMFVLARAYFMIEDYNQAIEMYDRIIARSKNKNIRDEAQNNKEIVQRIIYG